MALFFECMLQCARKVLDTADIVREAWFRQLYVKSSGFRSDAVVTGLDTLRLRIGALGTGKEVVQFGPSPSALPTGRQTEDRAFAVSTTARRCPIEVTSCVGRHPRQRHGPILRRDFKYHATFPHSRGRALTRQRTVFQGRTDRATSTETVEPLVSRN